MTTMLDVIAHSARTQSAPFVDQILTVAERHQSFALQTDDPSSGEIASGMAARLRVLAKDIRDRGGFDHLTIAETITLFEIASRLQRIPSDVAESIGQLHQIAIDRA